VTRARKDQKISNGNNKAAGEHYVTPEERQRLTEQIGRLVDDARSLWVFCHENPDGDTLGCCLAVYGALVDGGKQVQVFTPDPIPRMYQFMPNARQFQYVERLPDELPDVVLICDNAAYDRLGHLSDELTRLKLGPGDPDRPAGTVTVNIDHHIGNGGYCDVNLVDPSCGSCGELFYYFFRQLEIPISRDMAINLYAAILTDTGRFSYGNTNSGTFAIASELIRIGVDPFDVVNRVYNTRTPEQIKLMGQVLGTLSEVPALGYFHCHVTQDMLSDTSTVMTDTEGVMDLMKTVGDYEVCFFFKEQEDGLTRVSVRSNGKFNVNTLARRFGGGGHPAASGFTLETGIGDAPWIVEQAMREMRAAESTPKETQRK
jgi:phosphoesterase RecJ-like protein